MTFNRKATISIEIAKEYYKRLKDHCNEMVILDDTTDMNDSQKINYEEKVSDLIYDYNRKILPYLEDNSIRLSNSEKDSKKNDD